MSRPFRHLLLPVRLLAVLAVVATGSVRLAAGYLPEEPTAAFTILAPPPAADSAEAAADLETVVRVHQAATPEELAEGRGETRLTIFMFAPAIGDWFVPGKFPRTEALFAAVEKESRRFTEGIKSTYRRPRPYHAAPDRLPDTIERESLTHYSYPSGHSTRGTLFALLLAELFPEHREALVAKGRRSGWLRVVGGVHYPTDIYAGRVLGQELAREFLASPSFQADLAAARAELAAAVPEPAGAR